MICVGYVGWEAFDVILYIGRTLTKLGNRVLIIDLSETGALWKTIKHGMGLDSSKEIIYYRDLNYVRKIPSEEELIEFKDGVVFMNYGNHYTSGSKMKCNILNVVVNTFPNSINCINRMMQEAGEADECNLLIRDVIMPDDVDRVTNEIDLPLPISKISYLYLDITDYETAVASQISQVVQFNKISSGMKKYIEQQIHGMLHNLSSSKIKKAMAAARKGV